MKVLGINGSSGKNGNTAIIMNIVFAELEQAEIEAELIQFGNDIISPCQGCFSCKGKSQCVFQKDKFCEYFEKMVMEDGILLGSPAYSADVSLSK